MTIQLFGSQIPLELRSMLGFKWQNMDLKKWHIEYHIKTIKDVKQNYMFDWNVYKVADLIRFLSLGKANRLALGDPVTIQVCEA